MKDPIGVFGCGWGFSVPPKPMSDRELSQAIADVLDDPAKTSSARAALQALREELRWSTVVVPVRLRIG